MIYVCYHRQRTFVYEVEAAHARYPDSDPYWNFIAEATHHATMKHTDGIQQYETQHKEKKERKT